eukprot:jgi/Hompol1/5286/HPOL_002647-RA
MFLQINRVLSDFNIEQQTCDSKGPIGYLLADVSVDSDEGLAKIDEAMKTIPENISTRLLY